ncbi:MAG: prepilin-type N-terminal cleavage/methylation domain-containing protein [Phycisphaerales bacterium]|nr:prepilin-type N-terminal cleavage/methylation domain-containing protein [Phycisphaerales bacterium]
MRHVHRRGFTLIELLVVIAIIALLIAILLPALGKARVAAWLTKSLSNIRQITLGANSYKEDYKQYMPLTLAYGPRYDPPISRPLRPPYTDGGWCTWSYGGKNPDAFWYNYAAGAFDIEAADRPLNQYVYPEVSIAAPPAPARLLANDASRGPNSSLKLEVYNDPLDRFSYQHGNFDSPAGPAAIAMSSYDDVGTSYHFNIKWWDQVYPALSFQRAFNFGCDRLRLSDAFQPSRMVWLHDQTSDVVANNPSASFRLRNTANDYNKSVMAFMDGHAGYHFVRPGNLNPQGRPGQPSSYTNEIYTFVFNDLRLPTP